MLLGLTDKYDVVHESDCPKNKRGVSDWQNFPSWIFREGELALDPFLYCVLESKYQHTSKNCMERSWNRVGAQRKKVTQI